jgi:hypothetical protein
MSSKALVLMSIGFDLQTCKYAKFLPSTLKWAEKHGYDIIVIDEPLDKTIPLIPRAIYMQKLLICSQEWSRKYKYIVWKDLDILFNEHAPDICDGIPDGKIGAVNERMLAYKHDWRTIVQKRYGWELTGKEYYAKNHINAPFDDHFQAGLMVFQPEHHRVFLEGVYKKWIDIVIQDEAIQHGDQPIISFEAISKDLVHWMDERWNMVWPLWKALMYPFLADRELIREAIGNLYSISFGVHFASGTDIELVEC